MPTRSVRSSGTSTPSTHVLLWYLLGSKRLPERLRRAVDEARQRGDGLLVPTMVLAEALYVAEKNRESFRFEPLQALLRERPEFLVVGFDEPVFEEVLRVRRVPEPP